MMEPQLIYDYFWECETTEGTEWYEADLFEYRSGLVQNLEGLLIEPPRKVKGWGARLSMRGYLDCTPWCVFKTKKEALEYLRELKGDE